MSNTILSFIILIGVITQTLAVCPLGQTGDTVNLCRAPNRDLCERYRSNGDCINVYPGYLSGFITGEGPMNCFWFTKPNCGGFVGEISKVGWSSNTALAINSVYCWCH